MAGIHRITGGVGGTVEIGEIETLALGSLVVGDGVGPPAIMAAGANEDILIYDSTQPQGFRQGKSLTGTYTITGLLDLDSAASTQNDFDFKSAGVLRTRMRKTAGGNFGIESYDAAGVLIDEPIAWSNVTGATIQLSRSIELAASKVFLFSDPASNYPLRLKKVSSGFTLSVGFPSFATNTADRLLDIVTGDLDRILTLTGNATLDQDVSTTGTPTFGAITIGTVTLDNITNGLHAHGAVSGGDVSLAVHNSTTTDSSSASLDFSISTSADTDTGRIRYTRGVGTADTTMTLAVRSGGILTTVLTVAPNLIAAFVGGITSSGGGIGYATGAGGTVTQLTSRTTGVTLNKLSGNITLVSATTAALQHDRFTVTNSQVAANDVIVVSVKTATDKYIVSVLSTAAGSFDIGVFTPAVVAGAEAPVLNFAVMKAVNA